MLGLKINNNRRLKVLCLGAHSDDIEIGCGGTILSLLGKYRTAEVNWVVFSSEAGREEEARTGADTFLKHAGRKNVRIEKFRNGFFPYIGSEIKEYFEAMKEDVSPDVIFTHYREDLHQDHRVISELTSNSFRDHLILEYEIPKWDGDIGRPNMFMPLQDSVCRKKISNILSIFKTQASKHWFKEDLFYSILRIRGMECLSPTNHAEAYYCRKWVLDL